MNSRLRSWCSDKAKKKSYKMIANSDHISRNTIIVCCNAVSSDKFCIYSSKNFFPGLPTRLWTTHHTFNRKHNTFSERQQHPIIKTKLSNILWAVLLKSQKIKAFSTVSYNFDSIRTNIKNILQRIKIAESKWVLIGRGISSTELNNIKLEASARSKVESSSFFKNLSKSEKDLTGPCQTIDQGQK